MSAPPTCSRRRFTSRCPTPTGALRGADPQADRRFARAFAHRLRRPLPVPPLRRADAAGGDDGGARRSGAAGKARHIGFSEWTAGQIAASLELPEEGAVGVKPAAVFDHLARARGRGDPAVRARGISQIAWSPLAQGVLTGKYPPGSGRRRRIHVRRAMSMNDVHRTSCSTTGCWRPCSGWCRSRRARASRWRSSRSRGCCASPTLPRRSSAHRGPSRCTRMRRRPASPSTPRSPPRSTRRWVERRGQVGRRRPRPSPRSTRLWAL